MSFYQWSRLVGSLGLLLLLRVVYSLLRFVYTSAKGLGLSPALDWAWGRSSALRRYFSFRLVPEPLARLDARGLIEAQGFACEEHSATTEDGYVLGLQRIVSNSEASLAPASPRPPVLLVHGLMQNSESFLVGGANAALAFALTAAGYDVWLGNVRGTRYSRKHLSLTPGESSVGGGRVLPLRSARDATALLPRLSQDTRRFGLTRSMSSRASTCLPCFRLCGSALAQHG